jgi:tetratricopeptide (TPR) repeat protein
MKLTAFTLTALLAASNLATAAPQTGMDWYAQGRAQQEAGQYDAAMDAFQHAADANYQPAGAMMRMAQISAIQGRADDALGYLKRAYDLNPQAVALLPKIGGIPQLADSAEYQSLLTRADLAKHPCKEREEASQFDFWLGDWQVTNPQGQVAGENHISKDLANCVVRESWTNVYGDRGTSVNFYDPASDHWHQVWTSDIGAITHYEGEFREGSMRFEASGFGNKDGKTAFRRMTLTPDADGSVRQLIEDSNDGDSWVTSFDGIYRHPQQSEN